MADGIEIPIVADVSRFLAGTGDIETALDRVADAFDDASDASDLRDVEDAAGDVATKLGDIEDKAEKAADGVDELDDAGTRAKDAGEKVEKSWRDALDEVRKRGEKTGKSIGDDLDDGTKKAGEGFETLKGEANESAREAAQSFSGDPIDALDFLQETAAQALAGFGPLGAAAGLAIALGIGIGTQALTDLSEKINATAEEAGALALEWADATTEERVASLRDRWDELSTKIADSREWWEVWQTEAVTSIERVSAAADDNADLVAAFMEAFNQTDPITRQAELEAVLDSVSERIGDISGALGDNDVAAHNNADQWKILVGALEDDAQKRRDQTDAMREEKTSLEELLPEIEKARDEQAKANAITEAAAEASGLTTEAYLEQREAANLLADAEEAYRGQLEALADPTTVYQELLQAQQDKARETAEAVADSTEDQSDSWEDYAEAATVSTQALIDEWNRQAEQAKAFEENLAIIAAAGGDALARELAAKGPTVAGAVAEVIATASPEQQQAAIEAHGRATGSSISDNIGTGIGENTEAIQTGVDGAVGSLKAPTVNAHFALIDPQAAVDEAARSIVPPVITAAVRASGRVEIYQ